LDAIEHVTRVRPSGRSDTPQSTHGDDPGRAQIGHEWTNRATMVTVHRPGSRSTCTARPRRRATFSRRRGERARRAWRSGCCAIWTSVVSAHQRDLDQPVAARALSGCPTGSYTPPHLGSGGPRLAAPCDLPPGLPRVAPSSRRSMARARMSDPLRPIRPIRAAGRPVLVSCHGRTDGPLEQGLAPPSEIGRGAGGASLLLFPDLGNQRHPVGVRHGAPHAYKAGCRCPVLHRRLERPPPCHHGPPGGELAGGPRYNRGRCQILPTGTPWCHLLPARLGDNWVT
jgi:hypothetical protein